MLVQKQKKDPAWQQGEVRDPASEGIGRWMRLEMEVEQRKPTRREEKKGKREGPQMGHTERQREKSAQGNPEHWKWGDK